LKRRRLIQEGTLPRPNDQLVMQIAHQQFKLSLYGGRIVGLNTPKHFFFEHAHRIRSVAERIGRWSPPTNITFRAFQPHAISRSREVNRAVVVAVIAVRMVQVALDEIVDVIAMRHRFEFYRAAFRKKIYASVDARQTDLSAWLEQYNHEREHQGRWCYGKTPTPAELS
jgi:hypothetical protein